MNVDEEAVVMSSELARHYIDIHVTGLLVNDLASQDDKSYEDIRHQLGNIVEYIDFAYSGDQSPFAADPYKPLYAHFASAINLLRRTKYGMWEDGTTEHMVLQRNSSDEMPLSSLNIIDIVGFLYMFLDESAHPHVRPFGKRPGPPTLGLTVMDIRRSTMNANPELSTPEAQSTLKMAIQFLWGIRELLPLMQFLATCIVVFGYNDDYGLRMEINPIEVEDETTESFAIYIDPIIGGRADIGIDSIFASISSRNNSDYPSMPPHDGSIATLMTRMQRWIPLYFIVAALPTSFANDVIIENERIYASGLFGHRRGHYLDCLHVLSETLHRQVPKPLLYRLLEEDGFEPVDAVEMLLYFELIDAFIHLNVDRGFLGDPTPIWNRYFTAQTKFTPHELALLYATGLKCESDNRKSTSVLLETLESNGYGQPKKYSARIVGILYRFGLYKTITYAEKVYGLNPTVMTEPVGNRRRQRSLLDYAAATSSNQSDDHTEFAHLLMRRQVAPTTIESTIATWTNMPLKRIAEKFFASRNSPGQ